MKKTVKNSRHKAAYIRKLRTQGKTLSDDQQKFIDDYERNRVKGESWVKPTVMESPTVDVSTDGASSVPQPEETVWRSGSNAPPPINVQPPASSAPKANPSDPSKANPTPDGKVPASSNQTSPSQGAQLPRAEAEIVADLYYQAVLGANADAKREGLRTIPDPLLPMVKNCIWICAYKYLPNMDPELIAPAVVGVSSAFIFYQGTKANKLWKARQDGKPERSVAPPPQTPAVGLHREPTPSPTPAPIPTPPPTPAPQRKAPVADEEGLSGLFGGNRNATNDPTRPWVDQ